MVLENKLGIINSADLARKEERISKTKAVKLFETGFLVFCLRDFDIKNANLTF